MSTKDTTLPPPDERAAFESWIKKDGGDLSTFGSGANLHYKNSAVNNAWTGWKARAAIADAKNDLQQLIAENAGRSAFLESHPAVSKELCDLIEENERLRAAIAAQAPELSELLAANEMLREIGVMLAAQTRYRGSYAEIVRQLLSEQAQQAQGVPAGCIAVPVHVLNAASDSLGSFVSGHGWSDADMQAMDNLDAYLAPPEVQGMLAAAPQAEQQPEREQLSRAASDVLAERQRQIGVEGWTPEHDDEHADKSLATAAACYAAFSNPAGSYTPSNPPPIWPWASKWWKPRDMRTNLVKAGALILAEIERLDRLAGIGTKGGYKNGD